MIAGIDMVGAATSILVLREHIGSRLLPIWIGVPEAQSIVMAIGNMKPPRPMTHDLIKNIADNFDISLDKIVITDLVNNSYHARLYLKKDGKSFTIDARPSDAIALALRFDCLIFAEDKLLTNFSEQDNPQEKTGEPPVEDFETLKKLLENTHKKTKES